MKLEGVGKVGPKPPNSLTQKEEQLNSGAGRERFVCNGGTAIRNVSAIFFIWRKTPIGFILSWYPRKAPSSSASLPWNISLRGILSLHVIYIHISIYICFYIYIDAFILNSAYWLWIETGFIICETYCGAGEFGWTHFTQGK